MVEKAARLFDKGKACGAEANVAKMLAADASWKAGDIAFKPMADQHSREYHIERKLRETRLLSIAQSRPI